LKEGAKRERTQGREKERKSNNCKRKERKVE